MERKRTDDFSSLGIYKNKNGQNVYFDRNSKIAYTIQQSDIKKINLFKNRFVFSIAFAVLLYGLVNMNVYVSIAAGVIVLVVAEYYFRMIFFPSLAQTKKLDGIDFKDTNEVRFRQSKQMLWLKTIGFTGCAIGISVIAFVAKYPLWQKICIYAFALFAAYNGLLNLLAIIKKNKD